MTACVNCTRTLQAAWKYCIFCGTRTAVAATAPRSRPLPKRTPVPGYSSVATAQTPIVPLDPPAPLSAAPTEEPVSSLWPETMGERPSLRSALAATAIPEPTPPVEDIPAPVDEEPADVDGVEPAEAEPEAEQEEAAPEPEPADLEQPEPEPHPEFETRRSRSRRERRPSPSSTGTLLEERESDLDDEVDFDAETVAEEVDADASPRRKVNTLAILALLIGILACPVAALFGHLALGQLKVSNERGVIPAWIAVVLGYLWLGFWIVFGISYFATNG